MSDRPVRPSRGDVFAIALPLILSNLSVPLLGVVDTAVVGHLGSAHYLGAVAVCTSIFSMLFVAFNFLRMGTTGLASQALGAGDADGLRVLLGQGVLVAVAVATALLLLQVPIRELALHLMAPSDRVAEAARRYYDVRIWCAPTLLVNYVLVGWLVGLQRTRWVLAMYLAVNLGNIALDLLFVLGFGYGVGGVAAASVLAELAATGVGLAAVRRALGRRDDTSTVPGGQRARGRLPQLLRRVLAPAGLARLMVLNGNLLVRTLTLTFSIALLTARGARLGDTILAANAVLLLYQNVISYGLDGFAHAAEALVGRALGARDAVAFRAAVRYAFDWCIAAAVTGALVCAVAGGVLGDLLTDQADVREAFRRFLPWLVLSPLVSLWSFVYDGVFVGATAAREMRNAMLFSAFLVYIPALWLFRDLGNHGLWAAFTLLMLARATSMHWYYRRRLLPAATRRVRSAA